tara:strand:+ start:609 stop:947 length:339 start_codon:yes stop_codon:yes gene_type:complete
MMKDTYQYARIGTDRGGVVEITKRPARHNGDTGKFPADYSIRIIIPNDEVYKYDHPKDVDAFLELSLSKVLQVVDELIGNPAMAASHNPTDDNTQEKPKPNKSKSSRYLELD